MDTYLNWLVRSSVSDSSDVVSGSDDSSSSPELELDPLFDSELDSESL